MTRVLVIVSVLLAVVFCFVNADYCNMKSCRGKAHTACIYQSPYPAPRCLNIQAVGLTPEQKARILNLHNQLRMRVASGQELRGTHGPQPPATNMQYLEWDYELESIAQRWAQQCNYGHDPCRDVERFQVGQNVAHRGTTGDVNTINLDDIVLDWFIEVEDFDRNEVPKFRGTGYSVSGKKIGHYTQFVWANTNKIGCGAMKYTEGQFNRFYLVCNYGPTGNYPGQAVYQAY